MIMADNELPPGGNRSIDAEVDEDEFKDANDVSSTPKHSRPSSTHHALTNAGSPRSLNKVEGRSLTDRRESTQSISMSMLSTPGTPPRLVKPDGGEIEEERTPRTVDDVMSAAEKEKRKSEVVESPMLTSRRLDASFDEVSLESEEAKRGRQESETPTGRERAASQSSETSQTKGGLTIPGLPWGGSAEARKSSTSTSPAVPSRSFSSTFSWLSRKKTAPSSNAPIPPVPVMPPNPRRTTATSTASLSSDTARRSMHENTSPNRLPKATLQERFKRLRLQEETGVDLSSQEAQDAQPIGLGLGIDGDGNTTPASAVQKSATTSPLGSPEDKDKQLKATPRTRSESIASSIDHSLAPGTIVGLATGPSSMQDPEAPVDWDLWQAVVYEGPIAVSKSSPEELSRAIASGIPSAIRGVVWQVLAQSKNADLEDYYRDLVAKGTDKDKDREPIESPKPQTSTTATIPNGPASGNSLASSSMHKDSTVWDASSTSSGHSTPITTDGLASPIENKPELEAAKVAAKLELERAERQERQRKSKEDVASLAKLEKTIRKDLGSRSNYSRYAASAGLQDALFNVCKAYALFDTGVGYAQGMNFIVMPLLFNMPEEEAFCLLVKLMNNYGLREMFISEMPGLHLHLYQFERLLEELEPALCYHLHRRGIVPSLYATQWFLTLFAYRFPLQLVLRIYDLIISEGLDLAVLKFAIALMQRNSAALLSMHDMSSIKTFLNERLFDAYIDSAPSASSILESGFFGSSSSSIDKEVYRADLLVQDACAVKVTPETLRAYSADYESRRRAEKEREAELESLKSNNTNLTSKVRSLEERAERSDADHVAVASEMVRSKMENEELRNQNEELKGQVATLQALVDSLPAEVEAKMREEMEQVMKRNIEVQNENRALEEQLAEMERELISTKLDHAQTNERHENLRKKMESIRKALD